MNSKFVTTKRIDLLTRQEAEEDLQAWQELMVIGYRTYRNKDVEGRIESLRDHLIMLDWASEAEFRT